MGDSTGSLGELIRQIDEIKPSHLVFDTTGAMQPVVLENQLRLFFAALTVALGQHNKPGGLGTSSLALSLRSGNRYGTSLAFSVRAQAHQPTAAKLVKLLAGRYRANNLGIEEILLEGKRPLNGEWRLSVIFHKGVALSRFFWTSRAANRQGQHISLMLRERAINAQRGFVNVCYKALGRNMQGTKQPNFLVTAGARNVQRVGGSITIQRDLTLNGTFLLDGSKILNAGTFKEEL